MAQILPQTRYETYLTSSITAAAVTIPVAVCPATGVTSGYVRIEDEIIKFEGNSNPGGAGNLTSCTRGLALSGATETTAGLGVAHAAGNAVKMTNIHYYLNHMSTAMANVVEDTTPQLGGDLDVNGKSIVTVSNGNINLTPDGTGDVIVAPLTASEIVITDTSKGLQSAAVATYPSLAELAYVKGVTSALQTQLNAKAALVSPAFTTPNLGTPSAGTLTNCTGLPVNGIVDDTSSALGIGTLELGHASDTTLSRTGAGAIAVEGVAIPTISSTSTLTNKRITKRVATTTDDATAVINIDTTDVYELSAVANATEFTLTGTPTDGQTLMVRLKDAGVAKGLTWTGFTAIGVTLPTTTVAGKWHYIGCVYNSAATAWHAIAVGVQA